MHKNTKFTNTNTHKYPMLKLKMQAERDIPCEREIERVTERVAVGMKFISWVFQFVVREEVLIFVEEVLIFEI